MIISTRGRYALRILVELAERGGEGYTPMKAIAEQQGLSLKYLERILPVLTQNGILEGIQGKGGGYRLCRPPETYTVWEILRLTEGDLAPVSCMEWGAEPCTRGDTCRTRALWHGFHDHIRSYFEGVTLRDLMREEEQA